MIDVIMKFVLIGLDFAVSVCICLFLNGESGGSWKEVLSCRILYRYVDWR